jgi:signal transduction histidine kinase
MRRRSLITRLTLSHILVTLASLLLLGTSLLAFVQRSQHAQVLASLNAQAHLSAAYAAELAPNPTALAGVASTLGRRFTVAADVTIRVLALNGAVLFASSDLGPFPSNAALPWLSHRLPIQPVALEGDRHFVALPVVRDGRTIGVVEFSQTLDRERSLLRYLAAALIPGILLATVAAAVVGHLLARSLVRPLHRLERVAAAITSGDLSMRSGDHSMDEIGCLAAQVDGMASELQARLAEVEQLAEARQQFYRAVSHELRTPLTAILGAAENLQDDARPEQQTELSIILNETLRLQRLVDELLHPREAPALPLRQRRPVNLPALITEVCRMMQGRAERAGLTLIAATPPSLIVVQGDYDRLKQALLNLLDNAIIWTPIGGRIRVEAEHNGKAIVRVCDTGPGITPDLRERIWERGFSTAGSQGLGLALVRDIVEAHGGTATLLDGPGTLIEVRLPLATSFSQHASCNTW